MRETYKRFELLDTILNTDAMVNHSDRVFKAERTDDGKVFMISAYGFSLGGAAKALNVKTSKLRPETAPKSVVEPPSTLLVKYDGGNRVADVVHKEMEQHLKRFQELLQSHQSDDDSERAKTMASLQLKLEDMSARYERLEDRLSEVEAEHNLTTGRLNTFISQTSSYLSVVTTNVDNIFRSLAMTPTPQEQVVSRFPFLTYMWSAITGSEPDKKKRRSA